MSKIDPTQLYKSKMTSILHSLEAFADIIDFGPFIHHKVAGSIMGSPSATSAYLIFSQIWDDEAEAYLRHLITRTCNQKDKGGVPTAFPTTYFEYGWALSILLEAGFTVDMLAGDQVERIKKILTHGLDAGHGLVGFAPSVDSDADDSARVILTLNLLGQPTSIKKLLSTYEAEDHFKTYLKERNGSFSTNCNVLIALLHVENISENISQINKATRFLCNFWWNSGGRIEDKWHHSSSYPTMLLVEALARLLRLWNDALLPDLMDRIIQDRIPLILYQALIRTLQTRNPDGSWSSSGPKGSSHEETAFSILTLARVSSFISFEPLRMLLIAAIEEGRKVLRSRDEGAEYLWIAKVSYRPNVIYESYCLAGLNIPMPSFLSGTKLNSLFFIPLMTVQRSANLLSQAPLLKGLPWWRIQASSVEAHFLQPAIEILCVDISQRESKDKFKNLESIIPVWTGCNNDAETSVSNTLLCEMIVLSLSTSRTGDNIKTLAAKCDESTLHAIGLLTEDVLRESEQSCRADVGNGTQDDEIRIADFGETELRTVDDTKTSVRDSTASTIAENLEVQTNGRLKLITSSNEDLKNIQSVFNHFSDYILKHPIISQASKNNQKMLQSQLRLFVSACVSQANQPATPEIAEPAKFSHEWCYDWVRTRSEALTSCSLSFAFVACLLSGSGIPCLETVEEKYLMQDLSHRLSALCWMYNEASLPPEQEQKIQLRQLIKLERSCLDILLERLEHLAHGHGQKERRASDLFRLFCNVTELQGQLCDVKDDSSKGSAE